MPDCAPRAYPDAYLESVTLSSSLVELAYALTREADRAADDGEGNPLVPGCADASSQLLAGGFALLALVLQQRVDLVYEGEQELHRLDAVRIWPLPQRVQGQVQGRQQRMAPRQSDDRKILMNESAPNRTRSFG